MVIIRYMDSRFWPTRQSMVHTHGEDDDVHKKMRVAMSGVWSKRVSKVNFHVEIKKGFLNQCEHDMWQCSSKKKLK